MPVKHLDPKRHFLAFLGPGLITGASDDDPSGIATYSQAGAQFGYRLAWTMSLTYPLMVAIQLISARLGRTTGQGIAGVLRLYYPAWILQSLVGLLLIANIINLGADLGAMADALTLVAAAPRLVYVAFFAILCVTTQIFLNYDRYVAMLKWLSFTLAAYLATLAFVRVDWSELALCLVRPQLEWNSTYFTTVVAVFGTTISPYMFFWQASEEVEDIHADPRRIELLHAPSQGKSALSRIKADTLIGMGFSNVVALAIIVTTAATLHVSHITDIETSAQAAQALAPLAGRYAFLLFTLGIVSTGLLAVPVLAGSAAYAIGEARNWPVGLGRKPKEAKAFYLTLAIATLIGMLLNFTPINPIKALFWSAVINGLVAVPVMIFMMLMAARPDVMGEFAVRGALRLFGWLATLLMALAAICMLVTI